jgi:hypothetical protein
MSCVYLYIGETNIQSLQFPLLPTQWSGGDFIFENEEEISVSAVEDDLHRNMHMDTDNEGLGLGGMGRSTGTGSGEVEGVKTDRGKIGERNRAVKNKIQREECCFSREEMYVVLCGQRGVDIRTSTDKPSVYIYGHNYVYAKCISCIHR